MPADLYSSGNTPPDGLPGSHYLADLIADKVNERQERQPKKSFGLKEFGLVFTIVSALAGGVIWLSTKLYFDKAEGDVLKTEHVRHVETANEKFKEAKERDEKVFKVINRMNKSVLEMQIKQRAGDVKEAKKLLKEIENDIDEEDIE